MWKFVGEIAVCYDGGVPCPATGRIAALLRPIANALTLARLLAVLPFTVLLATAEDGRSLPAAAIFTLASLTDFLDGVLARRADEPSQFGRIADPIADRLLINMTKTKFEAMDILNKHDIPCGPILSMKEIAEEPSLRKTGTVVEVDHPKRGKYLSVGNPIKMSDSPTEVKRSPLLGEHTDEVLAELGYTKEKVAALRNAKAI